MSRRGRGSGRGPRGAGPGLPSTDATSEATPGVPGPDEGAGRTDPVGPGDGSEPGLPVDEHVSVLRPGAPGPPPGGDGPRSAPPRAEGAEPAPEPVVAEGRPAGVVPQEAVGAGGPQAPGHDEAGEAGEGETEPSPAVTNPAAPATAAPAATGTGTGAADGARPGHQASGGGAEPGDARPASSGSGGTASRPPAGSVSAALQTIAVPAHDEPFWDDLTRQLADEPQLRLRPRAAVRLITQPPPVIEDRLPFDDGDRRPRGRSSRRRRRLALVVATVLSVVVVAAALQGRDGSADGVRSGDPSTTRAPGDAGEGAEPTDGDEPAQPFHPLEPLTSAGVGPLAVGSSLRDLETSASLTIVIDELTFTGSGGTCFDATVTDVPDLLLRFRSPQRGQGVGEPGKGVLAAIAVDAQIGSYRSTEAGVTLGASEDEVRAAHPGDLAEDDHPYLPGGHVLTHVPPGVGNGVAYMTDGTAVTRIVVGAADLIGHPEGCP